MSGFTIPFNYLPRMFKMVIAMLLSGVIFLTAQSGTCIGASEGEPIIATRQDYRFDNSGLLIGGYNYSLSHVDEEHLEYVKDAGIDFLITQVNEEFLGLCDKYDIGVIAKNYRLPSLYGKLTNISAWLNINETTMDGIHDCIWGNDLIDEPSAQEFSKLGDITDTYYNNTDGLISYINLFPMYASAEQLGNDSDEHKSVISGIEGLFPITDRYKKHVSDYINNIDTDYISVDIYPLGVDESGKAITDDHWLRGLDILSEACRETNRDLWVITQAAGNTGSGGSRRHNGTDDIRWQAYVSLSFGAKAIIHACYDGGWWDRDSHLIDADGERTDTYYGAQTVDREMQKISDVYGEYANKGAYLVNGIAAAGTYDSAFLMPVDIVFKPEVVSADPVLVGCFAKNKYEKAYTFVNMFEPATGKTASAVATFAGAQKITVYEHGVPTVYNGNTIQLSIAPSDGVFVTVE